MADKKQINPDEPTIRMGVMGAEPPSRVRRYEIVDSPPGQGEARRKYLDAGRSMDNAATAADIEELNARAKAYRPSTDYARGGKVKNYCKGGKVISSKHY